MWVKCHVKMEAGLVVFYMKEGTQRMAGKPSALRGGARQQIHPHTPQEEPAQPAP